MRDRKRLDKHRIAELLQLVGKEQIAVAELEAVGLPLRIINLLEAYLGVIWLEDLLAFTPEQLKQRVPNLGDKSLKMILDAVARLAEILEPKVKPRPGAFPNAPWPTTDITTTRI